MTLEMSVVLSGYVSDSWNVTGFIRLYHGLLECQWFYSGMSVTSRMSMVLSRFFHWLQEYQWFHQGMLVDSWNVSGSWSSGYVSDSWKAPGMSVVLSGYFSDSWSVSGFFRVYELLQECQWFNPGVSVTHGMSLILSGYISDSWNVSGIIRVYKWLLECQWFYHGMSVTPGMSVYLSGCQWHLECQWFFRVRRFPLQIKTNHNNINVILFKVWLNTGRNLTF